MGAEVLSPAELASRQAEHLREAALRETPVARFFEFEL
jgi:hypothetical protein